MLSINHVSFIIKDCELSKSFYHHILGLNPNTSRPDLGYPGLWFDIGSQQIHLLQCEDPYSMKFVPNHGGRDRHLAINTDDLESIVKALKSEKITFTQSKSGRQAIFFRDPDGNVIEVIQQTN